MNTYIIYFNTATHKGIALSEGEDQMTAIEHFEAWYSEGNLFLTYGSLVTVYAGEKSESYKIIQINKQ